MRFLLQLSSGFFIFIGLLINFPAGAEGPFVSHLRLEGPVYTSPDGLFDLYAGGYLQGDFFAFNAAPQLDGSFNWRAGRPAIGLTFYKQWRVNLSYDFAVPELVDANLAYVGSSVFTIVLGQFSPVFGLANSSNIPDITFLELPLAAQLFSPAYVPGVNVGIFKDPITFYASVFGASWGEHVTVHGRMPYGATLSLAWVPIHTETKVFYTSLSFWRQRTDSDRNVSFSFGPEVEAENEGSLINTGTISDVDHYQVMDAAVAGVDGPFSMQSEYINNSVSRIMNFPGLQFRGYYVTASYFLTGESRKYSFQDAGFVGISPIKHRYGAWQLALRYSEVSLTDRDVLGGKEHDYTLGVNWYPKYFMTLKLNYVRAIARPNSNGVNQAANIYALRLQFVF